MSILGVKTQKCPGQQAEAFAPVKYSVLHISPLEMGKD